MRLTRLIPLALLATFLFLPLPWAQAHAELVSSNPVAGAQLDGLPTKVEVTFDGDLLAIGGANTNVLVVKDSRGLQIDANNSRVSGATLSVDLNPVATTGLFEVSWRVVSGDGHPEEGSYQFTVGKVTPSASPSPSQAATPITPTSSEGFWTRYGVRVMLILVGLLAIGIWARFEFARRRLN